MAETMPLDWSWGQAFKPVSFSNLHASAGGSCSADAGFKSALNMSNGAAPAEDLFASGYTINEFRTAVASPATNAEMGGLSLTRAQVPRPAVEQFQRKHSSAGRKRSCAEISSDEDSSSPASLLDDASASPTKVVRLENGESMDADAMDATGGSGIWAEELSERLRSTSFPDGSLRPRLPDSRKSARIEPEPEPVPTIDAGMTADGTASDLTRTRTRTLSDHDQARVALGVGWSSMPATPVMLAAARGWSRFIETSFSLRNVRVIWRNEGLQALLISAVTSVFNASGMQTPGTPGYYLFDEDLTQGRLVAKSWEKCLDCLRAKPFQFEGEAMLQSASEAAQAAPWSEAMDTSATVADDRPLGMEID